MVILLMEDIMKYLTIAFAFVFILASNNTASAHAVPSSKEAAWDLADSHGYRDSYKIHYHDAVSTIYGHSQEGGMNRM